MTSAESIDPDEWIPMAEELGESSDHPSATHGDFHHRPEINDDGREVK